MPAMVPVTTPLKEPIDAPVLLHTPPVGPVNAMLPPGQMLPAPVIVVGSGFTVTVIFAVQPVPME